MFKYNTYSHMPMIKIKTMVFRLKIETKYGFQKYKWRFSDIFNRRIYNKSVNRLI